MRVSLQPNFLATVDDFNVMGLLVVTELVASDIHYKYSLVRRLKVEGCLPWKNTVIHYL